ncbi:hypothetical protein BV98_000745 [Sphingobium herbicidovorans NBRC 16415]|uniref:Uncharacterized protein n=1 Tax=Sphingobium herbicidovorans (strain ATCC 700291 / DSM 11019 / CCUG 56400 / KCTC 2939 / LMG 18315 / NBRC 16415 / MH) TaxID=1219045 RepID=A0A086PDT0_SPHHM|nr:hypothetical protein BV98_000745 [Sphingobium herbicidovorans NBRC 16415]
MPCVIAAVQESWQPSNVGTPLLRLRLQQFNIRYIIKFYLFISIAYYLKSSGHSGELISAQ